ncbi:MFS transporter [Acidaminobacter sp. JC074]|uniref:MFS transporter n=1 Tax=Acidaminobacter sp. JC074 TaxID=2530199 RepID=UPI001F0F5471|nr:MFS transporter [Acidaminobacter sp. JC074]MCH4891247.1 MFS transporter [Acidaminobacter sp. JC074]
MEKQITNLAYSQKEIDKLEKKRWLVWGILSVAYIVVFFHRLAVGVVKDDLVSAFGISSTTFASLGAAYFYPYLLMQIPSGILADTLGARCTVSLGIMLAGLGSIIFGIAPNVLIAFVGRIIVGVGVSVVFISILKIQTEWFYESEFGTMSGLTSLIGNLGGILAQTPLALLVVALTWRTTFVMIGFISIGIALLCFMIVRNKPSDIGLPSVAEIEGRTISIEKINIKKALYNVCKNPRTWPPFIVFGGFFGSAITIAGTWGVSYLMDVYEMNKVTAGNYMMTAVIGLCLGSVVVGKLSDKLRTRKQPMIYFGTTYVLVWLYFVLSNGGKPPIATLGVLFFMMGFSGAAFVLGWACGKEVNNPKYAGISTSIVNIGGFVGAAFIPLIPGTIIDKYLSTLPTVELYNRAFLYCLLPVIIGYISIFFIKETNCKNISK